MAHMYPPSISGSPGIPASEKHVFERLSTLDDSHHVFHSLTWHDARDGECDFIIFHEKTGFIALEVKGGGIGYTGGRWYSTGGNGTVEIKDPARQAWNSMHTMTRVYERKFGRAIPGAYTWAVCFPDTAWDNTDTTLDLSSDNVLDSRSLENPAAWTGNLFAITIKRHNTGLVPPGDVANFISMFNKSLCIPMSMCRVIQEQQKRLSVTDMMQDYLLDLFEDKNRIAFQGAAGTGKTWIAMKKAKRLAGAGKQVLFLCYNRQVNDFLREMLRDTSGVDVMTYHSFAMAVLRDFLLAAIESHSCRDAFFSMVADLYRAGDGPSPQDGKERPVKTPEQGMNGVVRMISNLASGVDYISVMEPHLATVPKPVTDTVSILLPSDAGDDFNSVRLPLALACAFESGVPVPSARAYDAMIIDEGQDFHADWCDTLRYIFDRYRSRIVYIFYDDNQAIFTRQGELPVTGLISNAGLGNFVFRLRDNLRNTRDIHDFAIDRSGLGCTAKAADISGMMPQEKSFTDPAGASRYAGQLLHELTADHCITQDQVVVLSNRNMEHSIFADGHRAGDFTLVAGGEGKRKNSVRYRTIHEFKGLESDVVVLVIHRRAEELENADRYLSRELMYVGYTRAKHLLYVVNVG